MNAPDAALTIACRLIGDWMTSGQDASTFLRAIALAAEAVFIQAATHSPPDAARLMADVLDARIERLVESLLSEFPSAEPAIAHWAHLRIARRLADLMAATVSSGPS